MNEDVACGADDLTAAAVTAMGSLVYFGQYLGAGSLLDRLVANCPLEYRSGNSPGKREVIGTLVLAILNGRPRAPPRAPSRSSSSSRCSITLRATNTSCW